MVKDFIIERNSWIILFISIQLLALLIAVVDNTIPLTSMLYFNFLSFLIFIIFLVIRYYSESRFVKGMTARENDLDIASLPEPRSPFEEKISRHLNETLTQSKQEALHQQVLLEQQKDELLSWIHEVKTPMTAMHLIIDRVENHTLKAQLTHEWLRIHFLLDQQLHEKRMPYINNDLYIERAALEPLIYNEIKSVRSWCMEKGIGFNVDLQQKTVLSDAKWLAFIFRQLLTNAVKYSDTSSDITIASWQQQEQTLLSVTDSGRGIESKDMPRLFEKGFTSTSEHTGSSATGMGLYLAKQAADSLHILIRVQSEPGKGSAFTLRFPKENEFTKSKGK